MSTYDPIIDSLTLEQADTISRRTDVTQQLLNLGFDPEVVFSDPWTELEYATNGHNRLLVGKGDSDRVTANLVDSTTPLTNLLTAVRALKNLEPDLPVYLIHNHPPHKDIATDTPSAEDAGYWGQSYPKDPMPGSFQDYVIPAIYDHTTHNITAYPLPQTTSNQLSLLEAYF